MKTKQKIKIKSTHNPSFYVMNLEEKGLPFPNPAPKVMITDTWFPASQTCISYL